MKRILFFALCVLSACGGISKQARQMQALEKCEYEIASADSIFIAGTDVNKLIESRNVDMSRVPGLAMAFLRGNVPLNARLHLRVKNPSEDLAAINRFEYIILIKGNEIARGNMDRKVSVEPGETETVPVNVSANIYQFLSDGKTLNEIIDFMNGRASAGGQEKKTLVTLKVKPSIEVGGKLVPYPGYITIDKEVSSRILL